MFNHSCYKFSRLFAEKEDSRPEYLFKILNTPHMLAITSISFFLRCAMNSHSVSGRKISKQGEL